MDLKKVDSAWTYLLGATGLVVQTVFPWGRTDPSAWRVPTEYPSYIPWQDTFGEFFAITGLVLAGIVIVETWIGDTGGDTRHVTPFAGTLLGVVTFVMALFIALSYPPGGVLQIYTGGYLLGGSGAILCIAGGTHYVFRGWALLGSRFQHRRQGSS